MTASVTGTLTSVDAPDGTVVLTTSAGAR